MDAALPLHAPTPAGVSATRKNPPAPTCRRPAEGPETRWFRALVTLGGRVNILESFQCEISNRQPLDSDIMGNIIYDQGGTMTKRENLLEKARNNPKGLKFTEF
jgi:hypothetical protein